ncbi:MAG: hypothetical protein ACRC2B_03930 [Rubrivivax sp.]
MIEKILAGIVLLICVALLLRLALREHHRRRLDATAMRAAFTGRRLARRLWFWRAHRQHAAREAEAAIRRAQRSRRGADDNVVRPDRFKGPRKPH